MASSLLSSKQLSFLTLPYILLLSLSQATACIRANDKETVTCSGVKLWEAVTATSQSSTWDKMALSMQPVVIHLTTSTSSADLTRLRRSFIQSFSHSLLTSKGVSITKRSKHSQCKRRNNVWLHDHAAWYLQRVTQCYTGPAQLSLKACHYRIQ